MPDWRKQRRSGVFVNFEHISYLVLVLVLLTLTFNCRQGMRKSYEKFSKLLTSSSKENEK